MRWSDVYSRKMRKIRAMLAYLEKKMAQLIPEVLDLIALT